MTTPRGVHAFAVCHRGNRFASLGLRASKTLRAGTTDAPHRTPSVMWRIGWVLAVLLGCGEGPSDGTTTTTTSTESTQDGSTSLGAAGCAGGPACDEDEVCVMVDG